MLNAIIIGCGDIGLRVAQRLQQLNYTVSATARSQESANRLILLGFKTATIDLDAGPPTLPAINAKTVIFYFAPPPGAGEIDPRMDNFLQSLATSPALPAKVLYISTTAVYHESNGHWVNEQSPTRPLNARGKRRLDAESQLMQFQKCHPVKVTIFRVAGIYSANRLPLKQIAARKPILKLAIAPYSNRIHAIDLAEICVVAAQKKAEPLAIFNVSDGKPGSISQYYQQVAHHFMLPAPPEISWEAAQEEMSPAMLGYLKESKRVDSSLITAELAVSLHYPTLEAGLQQCVTELNLDSAVDRLEGIIPS